MTYLLASHRTPGDRAHIPNLRNVPLCEWYREGVDLVWSSSLCAFHLCEECQRIAERETKWTQKGLFEL